MSRETWITVTHESQRQTVVPEHVLEEQLGRLAPGDVRTHRRKAHSFAESAHKDNDACVAARISWQPEDEVHAHVRPTISWHGQWQKGSLGRGAGLDLLTGLAGLQVVGHPLEQVGPPEVRRDIKVRLRAAEMARSRSVMML